MQNKEQVFLYMKEEIERLAQIEEEAILAETKELETKAYQQLEEEAKKDASNRLEKELVDISSNASIEASSNSEQRTRKLVEKRDQYVTTIFNEAKEKLVAFVNSKEYKDYMVKHMEEVANQYPMKDSILYLRKEDSSLKDALVKVYGNNITVEISNTITIGGFIIENKETSVVVDESLDFALENQKDWFYKTSGLMIK